MDTDDLSFILNHLGEDREAGFRAVVPPVVQSGNFAYPTLGAIAEKPTRKARTRKYANATKAHPRLRTEPGPA